MLILMITYLSMSSALLAIAKCELSLNDSIKCLEDSVEPSADTSDGLSHRTHQFPSASPSLVSGLYLNDRLSDVVFIIGEQRDRFVGHRLVFMMHECAIHETMENEMVIPDVDSEAFNEFLAYFYFKDIRIDDHNVLTIMRLCLKFREKHLLKVCNQFRTNRLAKEYIVRARGLLNTIRNMDDCRRLTDDQQNSGIICQMANKNERSDQLKRSKPESPDLAHNKRVCLQLNCGDSSLISAKNDLSNADDDCLHLGISQVEDDTSDSHLNGHLNGHMRSNGSLEYDQYATFCAHNNNEPNVNVWKAAFKPVINAKEAKVVATCGGRSVCFIDYENKKVLKRLDMSADEELFSLSWTTLPMDKDDENKGKFAILAVGGQYCIYLVRKYKVYQTLQGFRDAVNSLLFHKLKPHWLLSSSFDNHVKIWDIDCFHADNGRIKPAECQLLYKFDAGFPLISICYTPKYDTLVGCGESSDLIFFQNITTLKPTICKSYIGQQVATISSLEFVQNSKYIAIKSAKLDKIIIADFIAINDKLIDLRSKVQNDEIIYQISNLNEMVALKYIETAEEKTFIYLSSRHGVIACGDDRGRILLYDTNGIKSGDLLEPKRILTLFNDVDDKSENKSPIILSVKIGKNLDYIIGTTFNNLVSIWKRSGE